jgi:hypothetical protein
MIIIVNPNENNRINRSYQLAPTAFFAVLLTMVRLFGKCQVSCAVNTPPASRLELAEHLL